MGLVYKMLEETVSDFVLAANNVFTTIRTRAIASYIAAVSNKRG